MSLWTDAHAHLSTLDAECLAAVLSRADAAGITAIANTATDLATSRIVQKQAEGNPLLRAVAGISPFDVENLPDDWEQQLCALLSSGSFAAIGEFGLDTSNPSYPALALQQPIFERQLALAKECDLPAILHSRGNEGSVFAAVKNAGLRRAVFHCFTGSLDTARDIIDAGYVISISGIATFKSRPLDAVIAFCPADRLLLETDAPWLAPVPYRGKENEPAFVVETGRVVAAIKGLQEEDLAQTVRATFIEIFGRL